MLKRSLDVMLALMTMQFTVYLFPEVRVVSKLYFVLFIYLIAMFIFGLRAMRLTIPSKVVFLRCIAKAILF